MGFRGYLPVTYRSYYAITTWGPLMGPMLCTKESRYVRMQLRSTVCTRAYRKRVVMRLASLRLLRTPILRRSTERCCSLSMLEETVTHEIQYFRYVTFEQAAAFTATAAPVVIRVCYYRNFSIGGGGRGRGIGYIARSYRDSKRDEDTTNLLSFSTV